LIFFFNKIVEYAVELASVLSSTCLLVKPSRETGENSVYTVVTYSIGSKVQTVTFFNGLEYLIWDCWAA